MAEPAARAFIDDSELIAERELELRDPAGRSGKLHVRIARPVPQPEGEWSCGLHLAEVEDRVTELYGEDSMQALVHAMYLAPTLIEQLRKQGFRVTLDGREELLLAEFALPGAISG